MSDSDVLKIDIEDMFLDVDPFNVTMDGISDVSEVATDVVTFIGNVIRGRLVSIFSFVGANKVTQLLNTIIEQIPDEIPIGNTDFYI